MGEAPRFLFDEHVSNAVADGLRRGGAVVHAINELGRSGLADSVQLAYAAEQGLVTVTHDVDFIALHRAGIRHAGIAWAKAWKYDDRGMIAVLTLLHRVVSAEEMVGRLEFL